jgi:hypothetical protein
MSKHDATQEPKSPAKPDSVTQDAELTDEQLNDVSGGFLGWFIGKPAETPKTTQPTGGGGHVRKAGESPLE